MSQKLALTTTSLHNVVISNQSDAIYYEVVTPKWEPTVTRISKMDSNTRELEVIAELQNDEERPTAVRLRGEQFRPADDFLKNDTKASVGGNFKGKDGKQYEWRVRKRRLELVQLGETSGKPVAVYHRHRRYFLVMRLSRQGFLEVQPSVLETLDSLIVSFLLMERNRRDNSK